MVKFVEMSIVDLVGITEFIHQIKPTTCDLFVFGIEKAQPLDQSVVFHMVHKDQDRRDEKQLVIISAQYITDHPFWKKDT